MPRQPHCCAVRAAALCTRCAATAHALIRRPSFPESVGTCKPLRRWPPQTLPRACPTCLKLLVTNSCRAPCLMGPLHRSGGSQWVFLKLNPGTHRHRGNQCLFRGDAAPRLHLRWPYIFSRALENISTTAALATTNSAVRWSNFSKPSGNQFMSCSLFDGPITPQWRQSVAIA